MLHPVPVNVLCNGSSVRPLLSAGIITRTEEEVSQLQAQLQAHEAEASRAMEHVSTLRQDLMIAHEARSDAEARAAAAMSAISESDKVARDSIAQLHAAQQRCAAAEERTAAAEARAATAEEHAQAAVAAREEADERQEEWHRAAGDAAQLAEAAVAEVAAIRADPSVLLGEIPCHTATAPRSAAGEQTTAELLQVCHHLRQPINQGYATTLARTNMYMLTDTYVLRATPRTWPCPFARPAVQL